jgi:valyl-tRNA synthetase
VDPKQIVEGVLYATGRAHEVARTDSAAIERLAKVTFELRNESHPGADYFWKLALKVDRDKLLKEIADFEKVIASQNRQLENPEFIAKAPEKVVASMRQKLADYEAQIAKRRAQL